MKEDHLLEQERLQVVIGGKPYILSSDRGRAYTLEVANEADHLLEHLKVRYPTLSEAAIRTLAVVNVLDQKNEALDKLAKLEERVQYLEDRLEMLLNPSPKPEKSPLEKKKEDDPLLAKQPSLEEYLEKRSS